MSDYGPYSTGWYSVSPAFAWWNFDAHRMAAIKARREAARVVEEDKQQKKETLQKLQKEQYLYMRSKRSRKENK